MERGDIVAYKASFLRSIGEYTGDMPFARGKVTQVRKLGQRRLISIKWENWDGPDNVIADNLVKVDPKKGLPSSTD